MIPAALLDEAPPAPSAVDDPPAALKALAAEIAREKHEAETLHRRAMKHVVRVGKLLKQAKALVPHGEWKFWVNENFKGSMRTAQEYMLVAANAQSVAHLPTLTEALAALRAQQKRPPELPSAEPPKPVSELRRFLDEPRPREVAKGPMHAEGEWPRRRSALVPQALRHHVGPIASTAIELAEPGVERERMEREHGAVLQETQVYVDRVVQEPWGLVNGTAVEVATADGHGSTYTTTVEPGRCL